MCVQSVEEKGEKAVKDCEARLSHMQQEVEGILSRVELQTGKDDATLQEHKEILSSINTQALDTVHNFISSELRQDLPTGMREAVWEIFRIWCYVDVAQVQVICPCVLGTDVMCESLQERLLSARSMCIHVC